MKYRVHLKFLDRFGQRLPSWQGGKVGLDQLFWVQRAMPVPTGGDRFWQEHTGGINRLEDFMQVNPTGDFLDQQGRQPLRPQLFVDTEKVDFRHVLLTTGISSVLKYHDRRHQMYCE